MPSNRPTAEPARLRRHVREVLFLAAGNPLTDAELCQLVRELMPVHAATDNEILEAAVWNLGRNYAADPVNEDSEEREWIITRDGIAKERIK